MVGSKIFLVTIAVVLSARAADVDPETALLGAVPSEVRVPDSQVRAQVLDAVCPGHVAVDPAKPACDDWDVRTSSGHVPSLASVNGILFGHFLSAESDDALVSGEHGETHPDRWGGTLLLTRQDGGWRTVWYQSGTISSRCMKIRAVSGRDLPVCESAYFEGGHQTHNLYAMSISPIGAKDEPLLSTDTFARPNLAQKETLDGVRLLSKGGNTVLEVRVHYLRNNNRRGMDLSQVLKESGSPRVIDFLVRNETFAVAPGSVAFFRSFSQVAH